MSMLQNAQLGFTKKRTAPIVRFTSQASRCAGLYLAAAFLAGITTTTLAQTTRLRVSIIPIVDVAPLFAAQRMGY